MHDPENLSASVHRKRFLTPSLALKFLCTGELNPRGISPIASATFIALSFPTTTPTTLPFSPSNGPPLLPGCTGAVTCIVLRSFLKPESAEITAPAALALSADAIIGNKRGHLMLLVLTAYNVDDPATHCSAFGSSFTGRNRVY
jgi:hypothetical protein